MSSVLTRYPQTEQMRMHSPDAFRYLAYTGFVKWYGHSK